jgi:hypothetical protein
MTRSDFTVKRHSKGGFVVVREGFPYDFHAHISTLNGCKVLLDCIESGKMPKSVWLQGSCRRLLTDKEFQELKKPKDKYYNSKNRKKM